MRKITFTKCLFKYTEIYKLHIETMCDEFLFLIIHVNCHITLDMRAFIK